MHVFAYMCQCMYLHLSVLCYLVLLLVHVTEYCFLVKRNKITAENAFLLHKIEVD